MKPIGWRYESHRHALAARGVKTNAYLAGKISKMATPSHAEINELRNKTIDAMGAYEKWVGAKEQTKELDDVQRAAAEEYFKRTDRQFSKAALRHIRGGEQPLSLIKAIDPKVTDLRRADTENIREFDAMHEVGTDAEEIKENLGYLQEQYEEMGMSPERARRHARRILEKSKAYEDALMTSDDPDEFMAKKKDGRTNDGRTNAMYVMFGGLYSKSEIRRARRKKGTSMWG